MASVAKKYKGFIWDSETREMFSLSQWQERRINSWKSNFPNLSQHIASHYYKNYKSNYRFITLGMSKFGYPDIVINNISPNNRKDFKLMLHMVLYSIMSQQKNTKNELYVNLDTLPKTDNIKLILGTSYKNRKKL